MQHIIKFNAGPDNGYNGDGQPSSLVWNVEVIIPEGLNNADYVNDCIIKGIRNSNILPIGSSSDGPEISWCKNKRGDNVVMYFGAIEDKEDPLHKLKHNVDVMHNALYMRINSNIKKIEQNKIFKEADSMSDEVAFKELF